MIIIITRKCAIWEIASVFARPAPARAAGMRRRDPQENARPEGDDVGTDTVRAVRSAIPKGASVRILRL